MRNKLTRLLYIPLMILCLSVYQGAIAQPSCPASSNSDSSKWAGGEKNMQGHFLKHQGENSTWTSTSAYTNAASAALSSGTSHTITTGPNAGRVMFWNPDSSGSGVFVVTTKDKKIISAFKPSGGKSYYDRQVAKDNPKDGGPGSSSASTRIAGENDSDIWTIYDTYQCDPHDEL